jgi:hypothetical protein
MSDGCERLFSGASILLEKRRRRLGMDITEANECLRAAYGPAPAHAFDDVELAHAFGVHIASESPSSTHQLAALLSQSWQRHG